MRIVDAPPTPKKTSTANYPTAPEDVRKRIEHVLYLYPILNHTMLQIGLGTGFRPMYWRPVLQEMVQDHTISEWQEMRAGPTGRFNMYTFIQLSDHRRREIDAERANKHQQADQIEAEAEAETDDASFA